ncbi:amidohydrolase [Paraglaciecola sp.]|uniref:amidohydrolase n=1 Tax=Paraglaciecola sp. TaxID=1920173 RepID=UPI0030F37931
MKIKAAICGLVVVLVAACQTFRPGADLILLDASINTQDPTLPHAQAIAIKDGRILAIGTNQQVLLSQGKNTHVVKLDGKMILPGLIDSHIHSIEGALAMDACSMDDEKLTIEALSEKIKLCDSQQPGDDWLQILNVRGVGTLLDRHILDGIIAHRPLWLVSTDAHLAWGNNKALELAGVDKNTLSPSSGFISHAANGEPTGLFRDGATALVSKHIPPMPLQQRVNALNITLKQFHQAGITAFLEANSNAQSIETFCALYQQGKLSATVTLALGSEGIADEAEFTRLGDLKKQAEQCGIKADTIKLYADGVMEFPTQTAGLLSPYLDAAGQPTDNMGALYIPPSQLNQFSLMAVQRGFSLHVHAIGDGAVREVLDAFAAVRQQLPDNPTRLSMAHLQLIDPADYARFAQLDVIASLQLLWAQPDEYSVDAIAAYLGAARQKHVYPAASLLKQGATLAGGSDWNVSSFNPFDAIAIGQSRTNLFNPAYGSLNIAEALSTEQLLSAYTINAAKVLGQQHNIGSLQVGKQADLIVLATPIDNTSGPADIAATQVLLTLIKGRVVFGKLNQPSQH